VLPYLTPSLIERFWSRVNKTESCWLWTGRTNEGGYGLIDLPRINRAKGRPILAHRLAWLLHYGAWPLNALHNCPGGDNPACVRIEHLWEGTLTENNRDMFAKGRYQRGIRHWNATVTVDLVHEIRSRYASGERQLDIANDLGLNKITVFDIVHRKTWKHVKSS
jgi:hypothetical protein